MAMSINEEYDERVESMVQALVDGRGNIKWSVESAIDTVMMAETLVDALEARREQRKWEAEELAKCGKKKGKS